MPEEDPPIVDRLADPESLLGMLQRGRGKGYLLALEKPPEQVWPLIFECLIHDPRMDIDVEDREGYYASVILATAMDLEPLRSHLRRNDGCGKSSPLHQWLPLATLACLANGCGQAVQILQDYVSYGQEWHWVVGALHETGAPDALEGVAGVVSSRIARDQELRAQFRGLVTKAWEWYCRFDEDYRANCALLLPICEPWKALCRRNARLAGIFAEVGIAYDQVPPPPQRMTEAEVKSLSLDEMFASVDDSTKARFARFLPDMVSANDEEFLLRHASSENKYRMMLAFRGLGQIGTPRAFETLKSYIEAAENADRDVRRYAYLAVEAMPPELTLETARVWFQSGKHHLHIPAAGILEEHATLDDVPMLIEALYTPETIRCEDFRLSGTLEALALFDGIGPIPELETVFCKVAHCYQRHRAAVAMDVTAPIHFRREYAFECLWDCHYETRVLGCETVSLTEPGTLERLKELAADEDESDDVREAAQKRIECF
jgi:hypothetical protein